MLTHRGGGEFTHAEDTIDHLIRIALIHYPFETIHPFLDGNGRIGRLIILLYLMEHQILSSPVLYLSWYLKQNRIEYCDRMTEVRRTGNYEQWIKFFLRAVAQTAGDAISSIDQLYALHHQNENLIQTSFETRPRKNVLVLFSYLEQKPILEISQASEALHLA